MSALARLLPRRAPGWLAWACAALVVALAQPAWAVRCLTNSGQTSLTEPIGNVASYPTDAPDGYVIWISAPRTTDGYCYKDLGGAGNLNIVDNIYFYANPDGKNPAAWGLEIGIRYRGIDHFGAGSRPGTGVPTGFAVPPCSQTDFNAKRCPKIPVSITYQVVVRKKGAWVQPPGDVYTVFQFDGEKGLNNTNPSFQYKLSGLQNLKPTPCMVDVTVTPEPGIVKFGQVQSSGNGFSPAVPRKPFSLALTKKCSIAVRVDGYFETSQAVRDGLLVPQSDSNFGIGIEDRNGHAIAFNRQFVLTQMPANVSYQNIVLDAVLKSFGAPKIGPFTGTATIRLFIY
ncbi:fimbrial protein [Burkholderia pseudomallei]|uniref:fimbrial protein n=1 Tax=Burkholderia pseudomallei TaxID=28450 RepID=UPI0003251843|nr:fimbrial protein [Burkholderia pseudomallei]AJX88263.1 fimbrial family protein [Burkholderia pseudomallei]MBF3447109.1 fimbrial protein [Burkholderia pseudomallei]MBF3808452.1 fimbrial protein [Burkholderia pseudomallei]MBF3839068.1 fimbrial protein [Burkholderia pseudomallei]MBO7775767.1 fimbrial protein [Burkholderia pseudomallei]